MTTITGFTVVDAVGFPVLADPFGNNVAFQCVGCGAPILAVVRKDQRGSSVTKPAICPACGSRFWVEPKEKEHRLIVHRVL